MTKKWRKEYKNSAKSPRRVSIRMAIILEMPCNFLLRGGVAKAILNCDPASTAKNNANFDTKARVLQVCGPLGFPSLKVDIMLPMGGVGCGAMAFLT